jgi:curli biogenesis system outer membrane secretion channel CsgG
MMFVTEEIRGMKTRSRLLVLIFLLSVSAFAQQKKRVAVLDFDYATVQSSVNAIFGGNNDVGKGIADLLVGNLVKGEVYSVVERKAIDKILTEQNFSNSDRTDPNTAAKLGRILGVDAIIVGSITQFGRDDRQTNIGGGAIGGLTGKYGLGGVGKKSSKAVVALSARVVSTDTAEILAVASGKGESSRSGAALLGSGGSISGAGGGEYDMTSSNFANTILGEAVTQAVNGLSRELNGNAQRLPTHKIVLDGLVADVSGDTIVLNIGSKVGVKVGDTLEIKRMGREIRDPATGKVIRRAETPLGQVTVTEVDELSAVGRYSGSEKPKVGDAAKGGQ